MHYYSSRPGRGPRVDVAITVEIPSHHDSKCKTLIKCHFAALQKRNSPGLTEGRDHVSVCTRDLFLIFGAAERWLCIARIVVLTE